MATLGLDFVNKTYKPKGWDKEMAVKIWDTAGQERFRTLTQSFYKQAQGIIITFDVTNEESFRNVHVWMESISKHGVPGVEMIMVGNKCDLKSDRKISEPEARQFAKENNMNYYDVSAKANLNIDEVFQDLMEQVAKRKMGGTQPEARETIKLQPENHMQEAALVQKKGGCC